MQTFTIRSLRDRTGDLIRADKRCAQNQEPLSSGNQPTAINSIR